MAEDIVQNSTFESRICLIKPKHVLVATHHKTGTHLFREFAIDINEYYRQKCNTSERLMIIQAGASKAWIQKQMQPKRRPSEYKIIMHTLRAPVDQLLSAYNYHKLISTEKATAKHFMFDSSIDKDRNLKLYCYHYQFYQNDTFKLPQDIYSNYTIQYVLNHIFNETMGILYEYNRAICLEWSKTQFMYDYINKHKYKKIQGIFADNFKLEQFQTNFNQTCSRILNLLNINDENERIKMMSMLVKHDMNRKDHETGKFVKNHITTGLFNKTKQLEILLGQNNIRCVHLKLTFGLDLAWKYKKYC